MIKKYDLIIFTFIINFHHFQIQFMKYTFSSNDQICEKTPFSSIFWKKIQTVKIPKFLVQYHNAAVISSCEVLAHSNKVTVWGGIL